METIQIILLAIIQGLTEFLPISSSAHLILLSEILGWNDQGLIFDISHFRISKLFLVFVLLDKPITLCPFLVK